MRPSTITTCSIPIWKALESYGCDSQTLFEQVGLDTEKLHDPNARYPFASLQRLWKLATVTTRDPCFGLTVARFLHPTTLHALGYAWMASESLYDALERLTRYSKMITDAAEFRLGEASNSYRLVVCWRHQRGTDQAMDAAMGAILGMCRMSYGAELNPLRLTLQREPPPSLHRFEEVFRAPVQFSAAENALYLGKREVDTPLPTANAELARANERVITKYLAQFERGSVKLQVEAKLLERLPSGHTSQESIAKALHLSSRSLQRKLKEEGTTYKQLLEDTRRELAAQYVKESELSVGEITFLLGFSEPANFSRAFKRWTGVSPSAYRFL